MWGGSPPATVGSGRERSLQVPVPDADSTIPTIGFAGWSGGMRGVPLLPVQRAGRRDGFGFHVRLSWGVRRRRFPEKSSRVRGIRSRFAWEDLPALSPGRMADPHWTGRRCGDSLATGLQHYSIAVELLSGRRGDPRNYVTDRAGPISFRSSSEDGEGPFTWTATARTADGASDDLSMALKAGCSGPTRAARFNFRCCPVDELQLCTERWGGRFVL